MYSRFIEYPATPRTPETTKPLMIQGLQRYKKLQFGGAGGISIYYNQLVKQQTVQFVVQ